MKNVPRPPINAARVQIGWLQPSLLSFRWASSPGICDPAEEPRVKAELEPIMKIADRGDMSAPADAQSLLDALETRLRELK